MVKAIRMVFLLNNIFIIDKDSQTKELVTSIVKKNHLKFNSIKQFYSIDDIYVDSNVNIVILDGTMEELYWVKKNYPSSFFIIFSNTIDFFTSREYFRMEIENYVIKDLEIDLLEVSILKAYKKLTELKDTFNDISISLMRNESMRILKENIISKLLKNEDVTRTLTLLDITMEDLDIFDAKGVVILIQLDNSIDNLKNSILIMKNIIARINSSLEFIPYLKSKFIYNDYDNIVIIAQPLNNEVNDHFYNIITNNLLSLSSYIYKEFKSKIYAAIGIEFKSIYESYKSYFSAKCCISTKSNSKNGIYINTTESHGTYYDRILLISNKKDFILKSFLNGDESVLIDLGKFIKDIHNDFNGDIDKSRKLIRDTSIAVLSELQIIYKGLGNVYDFKTPNHSLNISCKTLDELIYYVTVGAKEIIFNINYYKLNRKNRLIKNVCHYIVENVCDNIDLSTISTHFSISKNYFCNLFRSEVGETFLTYVRKVKIAHAKILFQTGSYKIYEVGKILGYEDINYFSKLFKKFVGMTPSEYKNTL